VSPVFIHKPLKRRPGNTLQKIMKDAILVPHGVDSTRIRAFGDDLGHERGATPCGTRIASFMIF
ncbi:hypothetical protein, partial [Agrobacterium tumefaciens]|uniref:hypothetical protein n=1 Tax=Agrobacterium tumefaciens TaxID=358 RepID=UPI001BA74C22